MKDWIIDNQMNVSGFLSILIAILNSGTLSGVYFVGALVCWGTQAILDQMRSGEKEDV